MEGIEKAFDFGSSFGSINLLPDLDFFNIKRKMVNDQNRKLIRASIAFDKILSAIDSIDKELPIILNQNPNSIPLDIVRLFNRIIMGIAVGNTDMHFKNFALIYTEPKHIMRWATPLF